MCALKVSNGSDKYDTTDIYQTKSNNINGCGQSKYNNKNM